MSVETDTTCIAALDFTPDPFPCEMLWGWVDRGQSRCDRQADVWLVFESGQGTVCRRLACKDCVERAHGQGRAIDVWPIERFNNA